MKLKKSKTSVWKGTLSLAVVLILTLGSCAKEPQKLSMLGGDCMEVQVTFAQSVASKATTIGTLPGTDEENRLDRVTILVFNADGSKLETALLVDVTNANTDVEHPKWKNDKTLTVNHMVNMSSPKKIYAIANWNKTEFDKVAYTEAMLKAELTNIASVADINNIDLSPMLMSGSTEVTRLGTAPVKVDMARQAAKIKTVVTIKKEVQDNFSHIEWLDMTIMVANIPNKSYIIDNGVSPADVTWLNSAEIADKDTNAIQQVPATKDLTWNGSIYVNENPIVGTEQKNATYIVVHLPYKDKLANTTVDNNYYKLLVNDTRDADSPHKVLRNTIYNFNISIIGMGLPLDEVTTDVNVENELTVNRWEDGEIIEVDGSQKYFNIDRTSMELQMDGKSLTSTIVTDVEDWKLINAKGETLFSFDEGKTAEQTVDNIIYTLRGTYTKATITATIKVSISETSPDYQTQNMFFIAKNLKVPFTVTLDNGFIPNSVLSEIYHWPEDILPREGGLQVAKRGNKVLPSGVKGGEDFKKAWGYVNPNSEISHFGFFEPGVEMVIYVHPEKTPPTGQKFGMGQVSTDAMATSAFVKFPAAEYCRSMGPEWYLPSLAELYLIFQYFKKPTTSSSSSYSLYTETTERYWSATQVCGPAGNIRDENMGDLNELNEKLSVWCVTTNDGYCTELIHKGFQKEFENLVRCVKGTIPLPIGSHIPKEILEEEGWPKDRLPKKGLQVATRGDHLSFGSDPEDLDFREDWRYFNLSTTETPEGVELVSDCNDAKLGMGKSSTYAMTKEINDLYSHEAAKYCLQMGSEWYLPSLAELMLIYKYKHHLTDSYKINDVSPNSIYWSATDKDKETAWTVDFSDGSSEFRIKECYPPTVQIRCVREI